MNSKYASKGFTLVELMVTLVLVAILLMWAVPSFDTMRKNYQLDSSLNSLNTSIGWARSEAIRRQTFVVVEPLSGAWANGWRIFADKDRNGVYSAGTDELLKTENAFPGAVTVTGAGVVKVNPSGLIAGLTSIANFSNGIRTRNVSIRMNRLYICDPVNTGPPPGASIPSCS